MNRSSLPGMPTKPPVPREQSLGFGIEEFTRLVGLPPFTFRDPEGHHLAAAILLRSPKPSLARRVVGLIAADCQLRGLAYHWPEDAL